MYVRVIWVVAIRFICRSNLGLGMDVRDRPPYGRRQDTAELLDAVAPGPRVPDFVLKGRAADGRGCRSASGRPFLQGTLLALARLVTAPRVRYQDIAD